MVGFEVKVSDSSFCKLLEILGGVPFSIAEDTNDFRIVEERLSEETSVLGP